MKYTIEFKKEIVGLLKSGVEFTTIAKDYGMTRQTLYAWLEKYKDEVISESEALSSIDAKIAKLSTLKKPTINDIEILNGLVLAKNRLEGKKKKEDILSVYKRPKTELNTAAKTLKELALKEGDLYNYQKEFLTSPSQFRIVLKSRQIGFSYVAALDALIGAVAGRNQLFLSASEEQALILMDYARFWSDKFGITFSKASENVLEVEGGGVIKALAHNFRTVQGFTGDIWMDEFAWYPNPKKIWHAFVPSIGAIKGRLTILSTPFEEHSLFHDLYTNELKYKMFERFRVDIYRAMGDGLDFDLDTMRALFDADTWASAYECVFIDDESSFMSISLIKSCVDEKLSLCSPSSSTPLQSGYDVGRKLDRSALASVAFSEKDGTYNLVILDIFAKASFAEQESLLKDHLKTYPWATLQIDKTGIGLNLSETMHAHFPDRVRGVYFTNSTKEIMALNLKKLFEDKRIKIPNDSALISDLHAIKRIAGAKSFKYDAKRNELGHADRFWALALATKHIEAVSRKKSGGAMIL